MMRHHARFALSMVLLLMAGFAHGTATLGGPTVGLWWNPSEGGRGYNIDIQGNTMLVTTFVYRQNGDPIWYLSSGTYDENSGVFHSSYDSYSDGQCFGCSHVPPTVHSADGGAMTITFHNNVTATLSFPGGSTEIVKYLYGFSSPTAVLLGEWSYSFNVAGLLGGDWIIFNSLATDQSGNTYATGGDEAAPGYSAVGTYMASVDAFFVVVTQGPFQHAYKVQSDDHRGTGAAWVIPTGSQVSGNGSPAFLARILFLDQVTAGSAQVSKAGRVASDQSDFVNTDGSTDPAVVDVISRLQRVASGAVPLVKTQ